MRSVVRVLLKTRKRMISSQIKLIKTSKMTMMTRRKRSFKKRRDAAAKTISL